MTILVDNLGLYPNTRYDLIALAASAGGLPTLIRLLADIPVDFPAPLVFIQHLAPEWPSRLVEIVSVRSRIRVVEAKDQMAMCPGRLFIAPPGMHISVDAQGMLALTDTPPIHYQQPSVDLFLESAARSIKDRVVAVIMSGMGSDGSQGCVAVKRAGGAVIAENPRDALFPSMPAAVIQTGEVDIILPVDQIGPYLVQIVREEPSTRPDKAA